MQPGTTPLTSVLGSRDWTHSRRPLVCATVVLQIGVLLGLAVVDALDVGSPILLLAAASLYQLLGAAAAPAWSSWMGQLVPRRIRGRYFGQRNSWIHGCTFLGLVTGGGVLAVVQAVGLSEAVGFGLLFTFAAVARSVSLVLLWRSAELPFVLLRPEAPVGQLLHRSLEPDGQRLVVTSALLNLAVFVAAPFFAPFMLIDLGFSTLQYTATQAAVVAGKVLTLPWVGARVDRQGARGSWRAGLLGVALVPLPWLGVSDLGGVLFCEAMSGASWGSWEVSHLSLLLGSTSDRERASLFAVQTLLAGVTTAAGSIIGFLLLGVGAPVASVFLASSVLRLTVARLRWGVPLTMAAQVRRA